MFNFINKKVLIIIFAVLFFVSLVLNVWQARQLLIALEVYQAQQLNEKILSFCHMFVQKVLMANKEIDFDTRLALETAVRDLNDQEIFDQWQRFTKSDTKEGASTEVKILLDLLVKKIKK